MAVAEAVEVVVAEESNLPAAEEAEAEEVTHLVAAVTEEEEATFPAVDAVVTSAAEAEAISSHRNSTISTEEVGFRTAAMVEAICRGDRRWIGR